MAEEEIQAAASSTTPSVQILNPLPNMEISDKYDGFDRRFHITAVVAGVPSEAVLEAIVRMASGSEHLLGTLCPVQGTRDTFEGFWDIPETFPEGSATFSVKAFDRQGDGAQVIATDQVEIKMQHRAVGNDTTVPEDVHVVWPPNDGPMGFFRNKAGQWHANVEGILGPTSGTLVPTLQYSTTPIGGEPIFQSCAGSPTMTTRPTDGARRFSSACRLQAGDRPSAVTAVAVSAGSGHSSDGHRVNPFLQSSSKMKVTITDLSPTNLTGSQPSGRRRVAGSGCLEFLARAEDQFGRPVSGANVDVELRGPGDNAAFGFDATTTDVGAPDRAPITTLEAGSSCSAPIGNPHPTSKQSRRSASDAPDVKAVESLAVGTNATGEWRFKIYSADAGQAQITGWIDDEPLTSDTSDRPPDNDTRDVAEAFAVAAGQWFSRPLGLTFQPIEDSAAPIGSCRIYKVQAAGGSEEFAAGLNIDFHLRAPSTVDFCGAPQTTPLRRPNANHPDGPDHPPETSPGCTGKGQPCRHYEGETNDAGEFVIGLVSDEPATAQITAWSDGEAWSDTDTQASKPFASLSAGWVDDRADASIQIVNPTNLGIISTDAVRVVARVDAPFLVDGVSVAVNGIVLGKAGRVGESNVYEFLWELNRPLTSRPQPSSSPSASSSPSPSPSEAVVPSPPVTPSPPITPSPLPTVAPLPLNRPGIPDAGYRISARIDGGRSSPEVLVQVRRNLDATKADANNPASGPLPAEWVQLATPSNGRPLGFVDGATRLTGVASAGAEGVELRYSTTGFSGDLRWKRCGMMDFAYTGLGETNISTRPFSGTCTLQAGDEPTEVRAVSAAAFDCELGMSRCASESFVPAVAATLPPVGGATPPPVAEPCQIRGCALEERGAIEGSDGVAAVGCEGVPCLGVFPAEWEAEAGVCVPLELSVASVNLPAKGEPIAIEVRGPTDNVRFCDPDPPVNRSNAWPEPEVIERDPHGPDRHTITGFSGMDGTFPFGVTSIDSSFPTPFSVLEGSISSLTAWIDDGDGVMDPAETGSHATIHWELPGRCTILGTEGADELLGTPDNDVICGMGGDDTLYALEGDDVLLGGAGNDAVFGDDGDDRLFGEAGSDILSGGIGRDLLDGGVDNDSLKGGPGSDELDGGLGVDECYPGPGKRYAAVRCESVVEAPRRRRGGFS